MHTLEIPDKKITITFAEKVEELTPLQAVYFMEQILLYDQGKIDIIELKTRIIYNLLYMKQSWNYAVMTKEQKEQCWTNIYRLSETVDSFFIEKDIDGKKRKVIDWSTTKNLLPKIGNYYGPEDLLNNCTFFEYKEAVNAFTSYVKNKDENSLNELVAILYRPKKFLHGIVKHLPFYDGQIRQKYTSKTNPKYFAKRLQVISKISSAEKNIVLLFMDNCENFMRSGKINIDGNEIDLSILYKSEGDENATDNKGIGMAGLLFSLAETKVFGDIEATANTNLWTIIARLYQLKCDAIARNSKNKQQKND